MIEYIKTNIGIIPLSEYKELQAYKMGFNSYEEMHACGIIIGVNEDDIIYVESSAQQK